MGEHLDDVSLDAHRYIHVHISLAILLYVTLVFFSIN